MRYFCYTFLLLAMATGCTGAADSKKPSNANTSSSSTQEEAKQPAKIEKSSLGDTKNVHKAGNLIFAGQFTKADIAKIKEAGIKKVITLRTEGEIEWDEQAALKEDAG